MTTQFDPSLVRTAPWEVADMMRRLVAGRLPSADAPRVGASEWAIHCRVVGRRVLAFATCRGYACALLEGDKFVHSLDTEILPGRAFIEELEARPQPVLWVADASAPASP